MDIGASAENSASFQRTDPKWRPYIGDMVILKCFFKKAAMASDWALDWPLLQLVGNPTLTDDVLSLSVPPMHEPIAQAVGHAGSVPAHPEEIRATLKLRLGKRGRLNATLRSTPAGLVTAGIMTAAIFLSIAALVRAARRRY